MASIQQINRTKNAATVIAMLHIFLDDNVGEDLFISNIVDGYRIATYGGERVVDVVGHGIEVDINLIDSNDIKTFSEDPISFHIKNSFYVAEAIVKFVSLNEGTELFYQLKRNTA